MANQNINKLITEFQDLSLEDKEYISDLFHKQVIECRRKEIHNLDQQLLKNVKNGNASKGFVDALYQDLEND